MLPVKIKSSHTKPVISNKEVRLINKSVVDGFVLRTKHLKDTKKYALKFQRIDIK